MAGTSAISMYAALLDRSVAQIGELAADVRYVDRQEIVRIADIWDVNTLPLFDTAISRPGWWRQRRARAALGWMADLSPDRRAWMIEQAAIAGHRLEPVLPSPVAPIVHHRDYQGQVQPGVIPLTASAIAAVLRDYDLNRAEVRTVRVERAGQNLSGYLAMAAPCRYATSNDHGDAVVQLFLDDVQDVRFDSEDATTVGLDADPTAVRVRLGVHGHLNAASAALWFDDPAWHLSHAGRAADAVTPPRRTARNPPRQVKRPQVRGEALDAAMVLHHTMLAIRSMRYSHLVDRIPLRELVDAFADAGAAILTAADQRRAGRDHAFRQLTMQWITAAPRLAHRVAARFPNGHWIRAVVPTDTPQPTTVDLPAQAQLTLATYTTAHAQFGMKRDASAVVNLTVPDNDSWALRAMVFQRPTHLSIHTAAFTTPHILSYTPGASLCLADSALCVQGPASEAEGAVPGDGCRAR